MIPTLSLILGAQHRTRVLEPRSNFDGPFILRAEPYDWATDDDPLIVEDLTPPHGIDKVDVNGWIRSELG